MLEARISGYKNLVDWTLSGTYDADVPILLDADQPSRSITKLKAEELVSRFAGAFEPNCTVCLHLANDVTYPILLLGILASGCRWTGTNPAYTSKELAHHLRASETKYVVTATEHLAVVHEAVAASNPDIEIILFDDILPEQDQRELKLTTNGSSFRTITDLLQPPDNARLQRHLSSINESDVAALMSTSGTTGMPKMAARSQRAMMLETAAIEDENARKPYEIRRLMSTPIFHAFTTPEVVFNPLRLGYPTYIMKRFDRTFARKIHDFKITETAAVPPVLSRLADTAEDHHLLQGLKQIFCGGAPLLAPERKRFLKIYAKDPPRIVQVWGMTEGGWFTTSKYPEDDATGAVGRIIPGYEIKVVSNEAVSLDVGHDTGELLVKGPQLMSTYLGNDAATEQTFTPDGWLRTGDLGYIKDGKVYIKDRIKDLIKVNGFQVAPAELEEALLQSDLVKDAGACAAGHGNDEHPALFVVRKDDTVTEEAVKRSLEGRLASYKVKYAEVMFVEEIPKSPTGKILRRKLREWAEDFAKEKRRVVEQEDAQEKAAKEASVESEMTKLLL